LFDQLENSRQLNKRSIRLGVVHCNPREVCNTLDVIGGVRHKTPV
jgi:hypothetical protein